MASTYNYLGIELMATGENAGTWGTKTNTNLNIIQQAATGYHSQSVSLAGTGANTTTLAITDGDSTSGAYTVQIKGASDSGAGYTFAAVDKTSVLLYINGQDVVAVSDATEPAGTTGQVQINTNGAFAAVSEGTSGFVLTSNGSAAAPTMQANAGIGIGKAIAMAIVFG